MLVADFVDSGASATGALAMLLHGAQDRRLRSCRNVPVVIGSHDVAAHRPELPNAFLRQRERLRTFLGDGGSLQSAAQTDSTECALSNPFEAVAIGLDWIKHIDAHIQ